MKFNEAKILRDQLARFKKDAPYLTDIMLTTAQNHSIENFSKQGFEDRGVRAWEPRKRDGKKDQGRAILVKRGILRRSIRKRRVSRYSGFLFSNLKYALIHNEGGIIYRQPHKRTATRTVRIRGSYNQLGDEKRGGKKVKMQGVRHNVGGSSFRMPRRQFVGNSWAMVRKIENNMSKRINKIFS